MKVKRTIFFLGMVATVSACGGGGGGDGGETASPVINTSVTPTNTTATVAPATPIGTESTTNPETEVTAPEPPQKAVKTSDLIASNSFDFTSSYTVSVDVRLSGTEPRYLNICREYTDLGSGIEVNYGSCLLQTALAGGAFEGDITVTNDIKNLVIAIWDFTGSNPEYRFWDRELNGDKILINQNEN